jgi:DNA-binding response OmpR family regulator
MKHTEKILIVEDDYEIARIISDYLRKAGFFVTWASTGKEGFTEFKAAKFDLVLVDLMLPEMDGFTLCQKIRMESEVPLLIVSARLEGESKIKGLDLGADDYLTKPFSLEELMARIHSHLRRYRRYLNKGGEEGLTKYIHGLTIDFPKRIVYLNNKALLLTAKEFDLLLLLAKHPFQTFSKGDMYEHIWQQADVDGNNTVTVHIKSLRGKLQDETRSAKFIQTVWGVGYRFIGEQIG